MKELNKLVQQVVEGDQDAYETIYQQFRDYAFKYAFSILGDYDLAEDASQEAFLSAYCNLMVLKKPETFPAWFKTILKRHSLQIKKRSQVLSIPVQLESISDGSESVDRLTDQQKQKKLFFKAIQELTPKHQKVIRLFYHEEYSIKAIGEELVLPAKTVKSRLFEAREQLKMKILQTTINASKKQMKNEIPKIKKSAFREAVTLFDEEINSIMKAERENSSRISELLHAKGRILRFAGKYREANLAFKESLKIAAFKNDKIYQAKFNIEFGLTYFQQSNYEKALEKFKKSQALINKSPNTELLNALVFNGLGMCAWGRGEFNNVKNFYKSSLKFADKAGSLELKAKVLNNLALIEWKLGNLKPSLTCFQESMELWQKIKNRHGTALCKMNMGIIEENLGCYEAAQKNYQAALTLSRRIEFKQIEGAASCNLASLMLNKSKWREALKHSIQAWEIAGKIKDQRGKAIALENQALAYIGLKQYSKASQAIKQALKISNQIQDLERTISLKLVNLELSLNQNFIEGVSSELKQCYDTIKENSFTSELPRWYRLSFWLEYLNGNLKQAERIYNQSIRESQKQGNIPESDKLENLHQKMTKKSMK